MKLKVLILNTDNFNYRQRGRFYKQRFMLLSLADFEDLRNYLWSGFKRYSQESKHIVDALPFGTMIVTVPNYEVLTDLNKYAKKLDSYEFVSSSTNRDFYKAKKFIGG